jgi:hypothetical protein
VVENLPTLGRVSRLHVESPPAIGRVNRVELGSSQGSRMQSSGGGRGGGMVNREGRRRMAKVMKVMMITTIEKS